MPCPDESRLGFGSGLTRVGPSTRDDWTMTTLLTARYRVTRFLLFYHLSHVCSHSVPSPPPVSAPALLFPIFPFHSFSLDPPSLATHHFHVSVSFRTGGALTSRSRLDTITSTSRSYLSLETLMSRYRLGLGIIRLIYNPADCIMKEF